MLLGAFYKHRHYTIQQLQEWVKLEELQVREGRVQCGEGAAPAAGVASSALRGCCGSRGAAAEGCARGLCIHRLLLEVHCWCPLPRRSCSVGMQGGSTSGRKAPWQSSGCRTTPGVCLWQRIINACVCVSLAVGCHVILCVLHMPGGWSTSGLFAAVITMLLPLPHPVLSNCASQHTSQGRVPLAATVTEVVVRLLYTAAANACPLSLTLPPCCTALPGVWRAAAGDRGAHGGLAPARQCTGAAA